MAVSSRVNVKHYSTIYFVKIRSKHQDFLRQRDKIIPKKICVLLLFFRLVESSRSGRALTKSLPLHKHQLSPFAIYEENSIDGFVRGLTTQAVQSFDSSFTEEV